MKVFLIDQLPTPAPAAAAAPSSRYRAKVDWQWRMEKEWRAEDISSPIRFCVWLTKTKKEYICTTIS